jgi:hypothetical protein
MTLDQLNSLTESEICLALYVVNHIKPIKPQWELSPIGLTWLKKGVLEMKLVESVSWVQPEAVPTFSSLLTKLGIAHEIKQGPPPELPVTQSL